MRYVAIGLAIAVAGCATPIATYSVSEADRPYSFYLQGAPFVVSEGENARVTLGPAEPAQAAGDRQLFVVEIVNLSNRPFNVGPENFSAASDTGRAITALSAEQLQKEANRKAKRIKLAAALDQIGNDLEAANAGHTYGRGSYSGSTNVNGTYGSARATTYGHVNYSSYDSSSAALARLAANSENREIRAEASARVAQVKQQAQLGAFQRQTVPPGQAVSSLMILDAMPSNAAALNVNFNLPTEVHSFSWSYTVE